MRSVAFNSLSLLQEGKEKETRFVYVGNRSAINSKVTKNSTTAGIHVRARAESTQICLRRFLSSAILRVLHRYFPPADK